MSAPAADAATSAAGILGARRAASSGPLRWVEADAGQVAELAARTSMRPAAAGFLDLGGGLRLVACLAWGKWLVRFELGGEPLPWSVVGPGGEPYRFGCGDAHTDSNAAGFWRGGGFN